MESTLLVDPPDKLVILRQWHELGLAAVLVADDRLPAQADMRRTTESHVAERTGALRLEGRIAASAADQRKSQLTIRINGSELVQDDGGGRNPNEARIAWPSGPANQVRKAWAAAAFLDALTTTPA